jgi:hypothetical protein
VHFLSKTNHATTGFNGLGWLGAFGFRCICKVTVKRHKRRCQQRSQHDADARLAISRSKTHNFSLSPRHEVSFGGAWNIS